MIIISFYINNEKTFLQIFISGGQAPAGIFRCSFLFGASVLPRLIFLPNRYFFGGQAPAGIFRCSFLFGASVLPRLVFLTNPELNVSHISSKKTRASEAKRQARDVSRGTKTHLRKLYCHIPKEQDRAHRKVFLVTFFFKKSNPGS